MRSKRVSPTLTIRPQERGGKQTARDWGTQMESAVLNNIAKEFWPDIRHLILRHD